MRRRLRIRLRSRRLRRLRGGVEPRLPRRLGRRGRSAPAIALGVLAVAAVAALAYWSTAGSGSATGSISTLAAPTITTAAPGAGTVELSWTTVTPPGSGSVSYYVSRDGGAPGGNCPGSSAPTTATSCTDSGVSSGTHQYTVTAVWRSWTARSAPKSVELALNPTVTSASPSSRGQGAANQTIAVKGTNFQSGAQVSFSGTGITVNSTSFVSASEVKANVSISASATTGGRTVTVTNPDTSAGTSASNIFTVNAGPSVASTSPSSGDVGGTESVTVKGSSFVSGVSLSFGSGVKVNSTTFESATQLKANITLESGATPGPRTITATNADAGTGSLAAAFTVNGAPTVSSASPSSGDQGGTQNVAVKGTNFESGATVSVSGTGVKVNSTSFVSATELKASITVESGAATGARTVTVTNPDATSASLSSGFTVTGKPTVTSTSPSSRGQGAIEQNITVKGTNLESGASVSFSGAGIIVNSTTFKSSTELVAKITVESGATTGARTVTITNPDATSASLSSGFTVNTGPTVTSISPNSGDQGGTEELLITGSNFEGEPTVSFGSGIKINSQKLNNPQTLKVNITIEASAATGARSVTVTNPADAGTGFGTFTVGGAPTVTSTSPSSRGQGASSQEITVAGTNFENGASVSFSGTGVTVNSTTFESAAQLKANVTVESGASTGARTVTVTNTDGTTASLASGFTVNAGPTVTSSSPSSGDRGGTEEVTVKGTNFESGTTVSLGSGVKVNSTTLESATLLKLNVTIESGASTGARTVTATNSDAGTGSLASGFTVNGAPTLTSTAPNSGDRGGTENVTVKGTNFESGASVSFSGIGVTVNSTTFKTSTEVTANVTVESAAAIGARTVTVANPDTTTASLSSGFTVNGPPTVESTSPSSGARGGTQNVTVKGTNLESGASASFGSGVKVNSTTFKSSTEVTANITIESGAATGGRTVTITNPDTTSASLENGFTVTPGPTVESATPSSGDRGGTLNVTVKGTNFENGASSSFGSGVKVNSTTFENATQLKVNITIESGATTGAHAVTVTNPDATTASLSSGFTVNGAPTVTSSSPSSADQGGTLNVTIKGSNFESGVTASFGSGVKVSSTTFVSATELSASITVESGAATGGRTITVTNPDASTASLTSGFTVNGAPTITSTSPSSRGQGAASQEITVKGTNFESGASLSFGSGVTVNSTTFKTSTEVTANVTIESGASTGPRTVTLTNPDATTASLSSGFTVNAAPSVEATAPSSRGQGASSQSITVSGTNFASGAAVSFSGTGIKVNSTTFKSSTELTANITIESSAATGARTVTVTNADAGSASLAGGFTVNAAPTVSSTTPSSRGQGASNQEITIGGAHFISGASVSFSGTGVKVNSTTFESDTQITVNVTVESGALAGGRTVTVTNPDAGTGSLASGFTVNAAPTVTSTSPSSADQGGIENVTVKGTGFTSGASASFGSGITVNSTTFKSSTELTANITIESGAATGARTVTVTNPDAGVGSLASAFTVNGAPTVTSTSPSSRGQGATSQEVAVKGTNFESGANASFGPGITVNSTTFKSSSELTANITIESGASTGARTVTVTNPDATTASLSSGFTVNPGPTITSPTKASPINPGRGGTTTFTMAGTNFVSGLTVTGNGTATVKKATWLSSTSISIEVEGKGEKGGPGSFTVTNPDGGRATSEEGSFKNG